MQQLSFLDAPPQPDAIPVCNTLDQEQRAVLVKKLARLIVRTIAQPNGEHDDERAE